MLWKEPTWQHGHIYVIYSHEFQMIYVIWKRMTMTTMMIDDGAFSDALKTLSSTESFLDANKCSVEPLLLMINKLRTTWWTTLYLQRRLRLCNDINMLQENNLFCYNNLAPNWLMSIFETFLVMLMAILWGL